MTIDVHQHIGDNSAAGATTGKRTGEPTIADIDADIARRLDVMEHRGVDQAIVIGPHGYLRPDGIADTRRVNDQVAAYRDRRPDRFPAGVGIVEPLYGARGFEELSRCAGDLGLVGISFHARLQGASNDSPWVRSYLERMGELGLIPFVHAIGEYPEEALWKVGVVADDFPDLPIVVLDAFSTLEQSMFVPYVAERCPNLVFDTALSHGWGYIAPLVERCGASRLVYGSDLHSTASYSHHHDPLQDILAADISDDDRAAILGGTIARILGL